MVAPSLPTLSSPVFGSLLCVLIGGRLMPSNNILNFLVFVPIITRHNEQTSPIRSNPRAPSLQRHSHCGRQFIVDCCLLSLNGSHPRPRPYPSLLDAPSLQVNQLLCHQALLLLLPPRPAAAAAARNIMCTISHEHELVW